MTSRWLPEIFTVFSDARTIAWATEVRTPVALPPEIPQARFWSLMPSDSETV